MSCAWNGIVIGGSGRIETGRSMEPRGLLLVRFRGSWERQELNGITLVVNFTLRLTLDDYSTITRVIYISFDPGRRC